MRVIRIAEEKFIRGALELVHNAVGDAIQGGPVEVVVRRPSKSREQEEKYHAMIGDIAFTVDLGGKTFSRDAWKALLVDAFEQELVANGEALRHPSEVVLSLDGRRAVSIRPSTRRFSVFESSQFIEYLYHFGVTHGARFSDKSMSYYEDVANGWRNWHE